MYKILSLGSVALRYAPTISIWSNSQSNCTASAISTHSVSICMTGKNVLVYSVLKHCVKPHTTSHALHFEMLLFSSHFVWKTMHHPIVLCPSDKCLSLNVLESWCCFNLSSITLCHSSALGRANASLIVSGSNSVLLLMVSNSMKFSVGFLCDSFCIWMHPVFILA